MRSTTTNLDNALNSDAGGGLAVFVELALDSGSVRFVTIPADVSWNSVNWIGAGGLGRVDVMEDTESGEVLGLELMLSGVDTATLSLALGGGESYQGRPVRVYLGVSYGTAHTIIDGQLEWEATIDTMDVEDKPDGTSVVVVKCETDLIEWQRPRVEFYNDADQQRAYPGDLAFQYVAELESAAITWPYAEFFKK